MSKVVLALSGGMDSTTLLGHALNEGHECGAVSFTYGSKHNRYELECAEKVARHYKVTWELMNLESFMSSFNSALLKTGGDIPEGHYEDESMSQTVVPGRNIIFSSILSGLAWSWEYDQVWLGIHSGDHACYPDCRPVFYNHMRNAIITGTDGRISLWAPFLSKNKTSIIEIGSKIGVPYEMTRTCYKDQPIACGKCGACCERREAFQNNGLEDPVDYEYTGPLPEKPTV